MKTGVLLINLGTPDSPSVRDVRRYLRQFLMDPYVIDIPFPRRFFLVNFIIAPFRSPKTAALYREIWTKKGSPLLFYSLSLKEKLQHALGDGYAVELAMRYQRPSIRQGISRLLRQEKVSRIIAVPLYPQYATSTTESTIRAVKTVMKKAGVDIPVGFAGQFYHRPAFIGALAAVAGRHDLSGYDHVLFSFHGIPERQILKTDKENCCRLDETCCSSVTAANATCYRATCFETARLMGRMLGIAESDYTVSFQSRLGKSPWIKPYTDEIIIRMAAKGKKRLLVFSPSFVADCLETVYEVAVEYDQLFREHGGEKVQLVESLNDDPAWVEALAEIIKECV